MFASRREKWETRAFFYFTSGRKIIAGHNFTKLINSVEFQQILIQREKQIQVHLPLKGSNLECIRSILCNFNFVLPFRNYLSNTNLISLDWISSKVYRFCINMRTPILNFKSCSPAYIRVSVLKVSKQLPLFLTLY